MFCPKCATQNLDGASFCRTCGANISLVPQALTGQLARPSEETSVSKEQQRKDCKTPTLEASFKNIFLGIAFLFIAIALSRTIGAGWWFWMLIPAFSLAGIGIGQYIRIREQEKRPTPSLSPSSRTEQFMPPSPVTEQLVPPVPSVTEGTTRHLNSKTSNHG